MSKEIIVTGINGFVGEHLARHLKEQGFFVRGIGREPELRDVTARNVDEYHVTDLLDAPSVKTVPFKAASAIIHLAGLASVGDSFNNPDLYLRGNAEMTENILSSASEQGFTGRTVVISTGALYDPQQPMPLNESSATIESSPYATGKLRAEEVAKNYRANGHDVVIVRPFNHIGPGQASGFLIPDLYKELSIAQANNESELHVGNLTTKRDYTDVRDMVSAYSLLANAESLQHDTYNAASGISYSGLEILEFLKQAASITNVQPKINPSKIRPTDAADIVGDASRLRDELGWKPISSPQRAIEDFVTEAKNR